MVKDSNRTTDLTEVDFFFNNFIYLIFFRHLTVKRACLQRHFRSQVLNSHWKSEHEAEKYSVLGGNSAASYRHLLTGHLNFHHLFLYLINDGHISPAGCLPDLSVALKLCFGDVACLAVPTAYSTSWHALSLLLHCPPHAIARSCCKLWQHNYFNIHSDQEMKDGRRNRQPHFMPKKKKKGYCTGTAETGFHRTAHCL